MTRCVCLTVDVEDWYDGMAVLGYQVARGSCPDTGLTQLISLLSSRQADTRITLFTVGKYAQSVRSDLADLAANGHEIGCHGPDHGRLPADPATLTAWLRKGREMLEDTLQVPVEGFRSPRFEIPENISLGLYRELLAKAGYRYVSDACKLGTAAAVNEFPVLRAAAFPLGGGSYQRLFPGARRNLSCWPEQRTGGALLPLL